MKIMKSRAELEPKMGWVRAFTDSQVQLIGIAEVVGAVGLIVPALTGILPILTPIAAAALAVLMAGGAATHVKLKEAPMAAPALVLGALAVFIAVGRFMLVPLS